MSAPAEIARIDSELAQLRADLEAKERQIEEDAARIVRFLEEDFPGYLGREVKARFIGAPEFADAMRADTVTALRRELEEEGRRVGAEIAAIAADEGFWMLDAPVRRVGTPAVPAPYAPALEHTWLPDWRSIAAAARQTALA